MKFHNTEKTETRHGNAPVLFAVLCSAFLDSMIVL